MARTEKYGLKHLIILKSTCHFAKFKLWVHVVIFKIEEKNISFLKIEVLEKECSLQSVNKLILHSAHVVSAKQEFKTTHLFYGCRLI